MTVRTVELEGAPPLEIDDALWSDLDPGPVAPSRLVFAAAHVVMDDAYASADRPDDHEVIASHVDWPRTEAFRRDLARHGLGIAEAMDTAQRFEIGWRTARKLIDRCAGLELETGFVAGAGADQLADHGAREPTPATLVDAVVEQIRFIQSRGGIAMILPIPALSIGRAGPDVYVDVYRAIIAQCPGPLFVHWLGPMFLPALEGYFPGDSFDRIMDLDPGVVRGVKLSMLDPDLERRVRRARLERDQIVLTGDDCDFATLIEGDDPEAVGVTLIGERPVPLGDFSHALLGIFGGVAAPAGIALRCLAAGHLDSYRRIMTACEALGRHVFSPPVSSYKAGLAFLSWLNGHQHNRLLPNAADRDRSHDHLVEVARLAAAAGALVNADTAVERLVTLTETGSSP